MTWVVIGAPVGAHGPDHLQFENAADGRPGLQQRHPIQTVVGEARQPGEIVLYVHNEIRNPVIESCFDEVVGEDGVQRGSPHLR